MIGLLLHMLNIAHGVAASLACVACFYLAGGAVVPRRWDESLGRGESPAIVGAALYVLSCWFGIALGIPLARLAIGFAIAVLVIVVVRHRWLLEALDARGVFSRATLGWLLAFVMLYVLAYAFTTPPATDDYLPIAWTGNVDLLTYVRYTKYLQRLGPSNLAGFTYLNFVYLQTPAVFYLLGWLSLLFGQDPLSAAMPAQFALTALIGVFAARISRSVFRLSRPAALAIAGILVSGPFFRYVVGAYFLSTLMSAPILLYLVWTTISYRSRRMLDGALAIRFAAAYVLLLLMYPFLLFAGMAAQVAAVVLTLVAEYQSGDVGRPAWREAGRNASRTTCAMLVPFALLALCVRQPLDENHFERGQTISRLGWSIDMARALSQKGVAGWPLDIVSPLAVLGLPGTIADHIQVENPADRPWALAGFCAIAMALGFLYFWRFRQRTTPAERALAGLAGASFILYCAYFLRLGPSYQQWKFASYSALPLSFVVLAGGLRLLQESAAFARTTRTALGHRLVTGLLTIVAVGLIGGNLLAHALRDPVLVRFPGALRNMSKVDELPFFRDMTVWMSQDGSDFMTSLALYFLPTKRVHVVGSHFRPSEPLSFEDLSRQRPLLIQNYECEGVGHDDTITVPGVGCLLLGPPTLALATPYPFSRSFLFIDIEGMTPRGPWGRWNEGATVLLKLTADPRRTRVDQETYVNLLLSPYLRSEMKRQRLVLAWGANQRAVSLLSEREWISLPVRGTDWTGNWARTLTLSFDLPDAATHQRLDAPAGQSEDPRPLAVAFLELSLSTRPAGREIAPSPGLPRSGVSYGTDGRAVSPGGRRSKEISPAIMPSSNPGGVGVSPIGTT